MEIVGNINFGHAAQSSSLVAELVWYNRAHASFPDSDGAVGSVGALPVEVYQVSTAPNRLLTLWPSGGYLQGSRMIWSANGYQHHSVKKDASWQLLVGGGYNSPRSIARLGLFVYTMGPDGMPVALTHTIDCTFTIIVHYKRKV